MQTRALIFLVPLGYFAAIPFMAMLQHGIRPIAFQKRMIALGEDMVSKVVIDKMTSNQSIPTINVERFPDIAKNLSQEFHLESSMTMREEALATDESEQKSWLERVLLLHTLLYYP